MKLVITKWGRVEEKETLGTLWVKVKERVDWVDGKDESLSAFQVGWALPDHSSERQIMGDVIIRNKLLSHFF